MTPTPEQAAIIEAARNPSENLLITALAGAAKTTTLDLICRDLPVQPILSLAFNKRIAEEMTRRLPGHVKAATLNSIGHNVWSAALGKRKLNLDARKTYSLTKETIEELPRREQGEAWSVMSDAINLVKLMKSSGYIPKGKIHCEKSLTSLEEIRSTITSDDDFEGDSDLTLDIAHAVLTKSITSAYEGYIDFDDQIYMSTLFGGTFPRYPRVLVDEAQDLSKLNHAMLQRLVTGWIAAVGDPWQSIYGFRGAVSEGMSVLRSTFAMKELPLSTSFRCPKKVVERARRHVPHMMFPEWAVDGEVESLESWSTESIPDGAAIICRNNAPLFSAALRLIRRGRGVRLVGADIGPRLVKLLKSFGEPSMPRIEVLSAVEKWEDEMHRKGKKAESVHDRAECLRVFAQDAPTLGGAIAFAEKIFAQQGPIQLMSGHKAKGLEFDTVYHLDPWRIPSKYAVTPEARQQEANIDYVITTRAKQQLYLVNLEDLGA